MTPLQKYVMQVLIDSGEIRCTSSNGLRVIDVSGNPVRRIRRTTLKAIQAFIKQDLSVYIINKTAINKLPKQHWVSRAYWGKVKFIL